MTDTRMYDGYIINYRPQGAWPPMNLKWTVNDPATGRVLHRAATLPAARAWIDARKETS